MEWNYDRNLKRFYGSSPEGEYSVKIDKTEISVSLDYKINKGAFCEVAVIRREDGEVFAETVTSNIDGLKIKKNRIPKLLSNKEKVKEIPNKKYRDLAQLVLAEAEKISR